ncbi:MAG: heparan-alpha-glucosaminide N-acetyltransferase domain-containing protein [Bryobacteraceae bacterium]
MKRFPFLDWMRGLAVVIMIQCHVFNSFARMDLRDGGPYVLSQFVGGMAAPLFLFMAGMTFAFQLDSLERREPNPWRRWRLSLRRAAYILSIAYLFRLTNWAASLPHADFQEITKVDILNCMGVGMAAVSGATLFQFKGRVRFAVLAGLAIAAAAPIMTNLPWGGTPALIREYLVPGPGRGRFPFFPCASYVGFGLATGAIVKRTAAEGLDRLMQWSVLIGCPLVFSAQYFSNIPYSIYAKSDFWKDSPALILIRVGIMLLMMAAAYLWTEFCAGAGWSWMLCFGQTSLMVYWVHVMLVYGDLAKPLKQALSIPQTVLATLLVILLMVALAAARLWWKARRAARRAAATAPAGG